MMHSNELVCYGNLLCNMLNTCIEVLIGDMCFCQVVVVVVVVVLVVGAAPMFMLDHMYMHAHMSYDMCMFNVGANESIKVISLRNCSLVRTRRIAGLAQPTSRMAAIHLLLHR
jgi:hypothetical protein